jgi:thiosulfate reductase cytochrome b subunit
VNALADKPPVIHPLLVRLCHWINAFAIFIMIFSGWRIYNASPLFPFSFPPNLTLGGWHAGSIQWHFAGMWLLVANGLIYVTYGIASGHYRQHFFPLRPADLIREIGNTLRGKLSHRVGVYNPLQKTAYISVVLMAVIVVLSGLSIWKPVQFQTLTALMGGYEGARLVHFFAMAGISGFVIVHVVMVMLVPSTLWPMFSGRAGKTSSGEH